MNGIGVGLCWWPPAAHNPLTAPSPLKAVKERAVGKGPAGPTKPTRENSSKFFAGLFSLSEKREIQSINFSWVRAGAATATPASAKEKIDLIELISFLAFFGMKAIKEMEWPLDGARGANFYSAYRRWWKR